VSDEAKRDVPGGRAEKIDELFASSRLKIDMIITLLTEKVGARVENITLEGKGVAELEPLLDHLERLIFLGQMNRAKVRDLVHMAPKKYQRILSDAELTAELRPVRDADNFPKRGPRGPREDVSPEQPE
jgi:hypothetical protein